MELLQTLLNSPLNLDFVSLFWAGLSGLWPRHYLSLERAEERAEGMLSSSRNSNPSCAEPSQASTMVHIQIYYSRCCKLKTCACLCRIVHAGRWGGPEGPGGLGFLKSLSFIHTLYLYLHFDKCSCCCEGGLCSAAGWCTSRKKEERMTFVFIELGVLFALYWDLRSTTSSSPTRAFGVESGCSHLTWVKIRMKTLKQPQVTSASPKRVSHHSSSLSPGGSRSHDSKRTLPPSQFTEHPSGSTVLFLSVCRDSEWSGRDDLTELFSSFARLDACGFHPNSLYDSCVAAFPDFSGYFGYQNTRWPKLFKWDQQGNKSEWCLNCADLDPWRSSSHRLSRAASHKLDPNPLTEPRCRGLSAVCINTFSRDWSWH